MTDQNSQESFGDTPVSAQPGKTQPRQSVKKAKRKPLPPWRVVLHNDDVNDIEDVVKAICKLTPLNTQEAQARTMEAHETGVALLLVTHRERAELYVEQFASCGLTATAEPET